MKFAQFCFLGRKIMSFNDDTFYSEIRRQILQLIAEDDEDLLIRKKSFNEASSVSVGVGSTMLAHKSKSPLANHFCSRESHCSGSPQGLVNMRRSGRGTGVFIPQVVTGNTYQRPGTMNGRKQIYKPVAKKY
ncbi:hypothetical protein VNO78_09517 [Psophocarpus tetragonolobus]|uniref:Uncharacterized protein n=1 Tax=Psophocarpus tetragonolobus TaxID=3891 RepID=A0AAN9SZD4_PSOTE